MLDLNKEEISFAINAVRSAATLVKQVQSELVSTKLTKDDRSPVTVADYASHVITSYSIHYTKLYEELVQKTCAV